MLSKFIAALALVALAVAQVPTSPRFSLTAPSYDLFRKKTLHDDTVQQSFAYDNVNRRLFVAQRRNGSPTKAGDLCITQLDFSGKQVGYMHLEGFGHGVSFAAQGVGSATYLWTEVDVDDEGYGKRLARFKFANGKTVASTSSSLTKFTPVPEATLHTCSIDPVYNRLVVRYHIDGVGKHIAVYDLDDATKGDFSERLVDFRQPVPERLAERFQGYAAYGQYLYLMWGDSKEITGGVVNSQLVGVDMNTGEIVQGPVMTRAGESLDFREAEGLAIYQKANGEVRLFLGFASGVEKDRRSNLFYKDALV